MRGVNKWMIDYITVDEKQRSVILVAKEGCLTGHIIMQLQLDKKQELMGVWMEE